MGSHYTVKHPGEVRKCSGADKCSIAGECPHSRVHCREGICHYPCQGDNGVKGSMCKVAAIEPLVAI